MKTLRLSSLLLALLSILNACTKETSSLTDKDSGQRSKVMSPAAMGNGNGDVEIPLVIEFNPSPCIVNNSVAVIGKFNPAPGQATPECGKLQIHQLLNGNWVTVGSAVTVSSTVQQVSFNFIPALCGNDNYFFKAHYVKGGCSGFKTTQSAPTAMNVVNDCQFSLQGAVTGTPQNMGNGKFRFTITYSLNVCNVEFDKLKTQGGLTNGVSNVQAFEATTSTPGTSTNQIIKWEEVSTTPVTGGTRTYTVSFEKNYSGSGPIELTGNWSTTATLNGTVTGYATFPSITYNP